MPEYSYVAQTSTGRIERGRITAGAPADVRQRLVSAGQKLVSIQEVRATYSTLHRLLTTLRSRPLPFRRAVDVELVLQQLAVMLSSGLELAPSLRELSIHGPNPRQKQICANIAEAIERGQSFESALSETAAFPAVVARLVRVGEETGELPVILQQAAEFIEYRRVARGNLLAALAYPLVVALAACAVAVYLVGWAIPKLATFLHALGRELPAMTQSLIDASSLIQRYGPLGFVVTVAATVAIVLVYRWKPGRYQIDRSLLHMPLVGPLTQIAETQQLAGSLALMLRSGVFLPEALRTAAMLHRNQYLAAQVTNAADNLALGKNLASALSGRGFAPMLSSMIAVGERTGELPRTLEHVATFHTAQLDAKLTRFGKLIEPTIIVLVGGGVGYVYIAFFMALLSAGGNFK